MDTSQGDSEFSQSLHRKQLLKGILDQGQKLERELPRHSSQAALSDISSFISQSNYIINRGEVKDRIEHTTEVVMDSHVLKMNHELLSKVLQQSLEFNEHSFQNAIDHAVNNGISSDWDNVAEIACSLSRCVNVHSTMLGAIEVEIKEKIVKERQQRKRTIIADEKRPETVMRLDRQDKGADKMNVMREQVREILKANNRRSIPFYKLIVDPNNFMNSVESAFQLAFLVRDGTIGIDVGEDGHPEVRLVQSAERKIEMNTAQWICSLDEAKCKEMAKFYKISAPILKINTEETYCEDSSD